MPRTRNIRPGFFQNEALCSLPPLARLFFAGLWCWADRDGRLEDRPKKLKAQILPYDKADPEAILNALAKSPERFIIRYTVKGSKYIQVTKFDEHQNPHCKEQASTMPAPCKPGASENGIASPLEPPQEDLLLDPNHSPLVSGASTVLAPCKPSASGFDLFWKAYPRKVGKTKALHAYQQALGRLGKDPRFADGGARDYLQAKVAEFRATPKGTSGRFCPHPTTWLNEGRYDDDPAAWQDSDKQPPPQTPTIDFPGASHDPR